ncbi:MAG TPA: 3-deoxy-D-manno-octulosonic acid transferase, partial [Planctomycetota bacterium]|nr:3-deoxy-D-manno-octulosonic acid transferase [Planctomycetota bacterium]
RWSALRDSLAASGPPTLDGILVVDTLGELERFYALADVVFVGGSLVPRGGHNFFEAARLEKALLFGPHHENFEEEARLLLAEGAAIRVEDAAELQAALGRLLGESEERRRLAARALEATRRLRGASQAHLAWMERHLRLYLPWKSC